MWYRTQEEEAAKRVLPLRLVSGWCQKRKIFMSIVRDDTLPFANNSKRLKYINSDRYH